MFTYFTQRASLLMFSLSLFACQPGGSSDSCDPTKENNCVCTLPSGESCSLGELYCQCTSQEDDDDQGVSTGDSGLSNDSGLGEDSGLSNDSGVSNDSGTTPLCEEIECPEGERCNPQTGRCVSDELECLNPCQLEGQVSCSDNGQINVCEQRGECLTYSDPMDCPVNRTCRGEGDQASCVCANGLVETEEGQCVEPRRWSDDVTLIELTNEGTGEVVADFSEGVSNDLGEWGTPREAGCWQTSQRFNFWDGKPRYFALAEPLQAWQEVTVTVIPGSMDQDPELFAYLQPVGQNISPPASEGIGMCKTSFSASSLGNEGVVESVSFQTYAAVGPQDLLIGVTNESSGSFTVRVEVSDMRDRCFGENPNPSAWPPYVQEINLDREVDQYTRRGIARSNLESGAPMCELAWVNDLFCDPRTQEVYYEGHHVMFSLDQPEYSLQIVTVTPDPGVEVTLWGYAQGTTNHSVPPAASGIACEVSHPTDGLNRPRNPGQPETIEFYAFRNSYNNLIGISGFSRDGTEGGFTITVDQYLTAMDACQEEDFSAVQGFESWRDARMVNLIPNRVGEQTIAGDLSRGEALCGLSWMSNAFCVPDTQFHYFGGNHILYALEEPLAPGEVVEIEVIPEPDVEVSLYGYQTNTTTFSVPPVVSSSVCEASHRLDLQHRPGYGEIERIEFQNPAGNPNSYNVLFGVAGYTEQWPPRPDDIGIGDEGAYTLKVTKRVAPPAHCPESLPGATYAAWPGNVNLINLNQANRAQVEGDLSQGSCMNLDFAEDIFCFPGTQNQHFEGHHVFYVVDQPMPPNSIMRVTVTPSPEVEVSLYGYNVPTGVQSVPPMVRDAISCEASYTLDGISHTPNPGEPEVIEFQNPTNNLYDVFFGVAGDDLTGESGDYLIDIEMLVSEPHCPESLERAMSDDQWPSDVNVISLTNGEAIQSGNLSEGSCTDLDFAEQAFCFPGTQNQHFQGNHVFYALDIPQPPNSVLTISVEPNADVEVSLYGWQANPSDYTVPPLVNATTCEASHTQNGVQHNPNPGIPETIQFFNPSSNPNRYGIFFAVAGDRDTGEVGQYTVKVNLDVGETFCEESLSRPSDSSCWPSDVTVISRGETEANLTRGACTNLGWADNSSVACFPGTESDMFDGHHLFFALDEPMGPNSELSITATPSRAITDLSIYAYMMGVNQCLVPPAVGGVLTCEASYAPFNTTNPGESENVSLNNPTGNSYNVLIGVAGANGLSSGDFTLSVTER